MLRCVPWILLSLAGHAVGRLQVPPLSPWRSLVPSKAVPEVSKHMLDMCKKYYRDTTLDHFSWVSCGEPGMHGMPQPRHAASCNKYGAAGATT